MILVFSDVRGMCVWYSQVTLRVILHAAHCLTELIRRFTCVGGSKASDRLCNIREPVR